MPSQGKRSVHDMRRWEMTGIILMYYQLACEHIYVRIYLRTWEFHKDPSDNEFESWIDRIESTDP